MKIRVLIIDDEPLVRAGLRDQLARETDVEVVGDACGQAGRVDRPQQQRCPRRSFGRLSQAKGSTW